MLGFPTRCSGRFVVAALLMGTQVPHVRASSVTSWDMLPSEDRDSVLSLDGSVHLVDPVKIAPFDAATQTVDTDSFSEVPMPGADEEDEAAGLVSASAGAYFVDETEESPVQPATLADMILLPLTEENIALLLTALEESGDFRQKSPSLSEENVDISTGQAASEVFPQFAPGPKYQMPSAFYPRFRRPGHLPMIPEETQNIARPENSFEDDLDFIAVPASPPPAEGVTEFLSAEALAAPTPEAEIAPSVAPQETAAASELDKLMYGGFTVVVVGAVAASVLAVMRK